MKRYFDHIQIMEDLKKEYRRLANILHPDHGGNESEFIEMSNQYEEAAKRIRNGSSSSNAANDYEDAVSYKDAVDAALNCDGVILDLTGIWLWAYGNTYPHKETLKAAGFHYSTGKKKWYWKPSGRDIRRKASNYTYEEIQLKYGSSRIMKGDTEKPNYRIA